MKKLEKYMEEQDEDERQLIMKMIGVSIPASRPSK